MPAKSQAQQKFMGMVHALQKGDIEPSSVSKDVRDAADSMSDKDAKDFASTPHKGLPKKVKQEILNKLKEYANSMGRDHLGGDDYTSSKKGGLRDFDGYDNVDYNKDMPMDEGFKSEYEGNDGIVWKKGKTQKGVTNFTPYYKGHNIDFGGHNFKTEKELKDFIKNYILSNQLYRKYRNESIDEVGTNDWHFKAIKKLWDKAGSFTKKKIAGLITKNPKATWDKIERALRGSDYDEVTYYTDMLHLESIVNKLKSIEEGKGRDLATKLIRNARQSMRKLTDDDVEEFRKEVALAFDLKESKLKGQLAGDSVQDIIKSIGSRFVSGEIKNTKRDGKTYLKLTDEKFGSGVVKILKSRFGIDAKIDYYGGKGKVASSPSVSFFSDTIIAESKGVPQNYMQGRTSDYHTALRGKNKDYSGGTNFKKTNHGQPDLENDEEDQETNHLSNKQIALKAESFDKVEHLKLLNLALRTMPGSQKQKEIIKKLNKIRVAGGMRPLKETSIVEYGQRLDLSFIEDKEARLDGTPEPKDAINRDLDEGTMIRRAVDIAQELLPKDTWSRFASDGKKNAEFVKNVVRDLTQSLNKFYKNHNINVRIKEEQGDSNVDMVLGVLSILRQIEDKENRQKVAVDMIKKFKEQNIDFDYKEFLELMKEHNK